MVRVQIEGGVLPEYASEGAAGADLRAREALAIPPGGRAAVPPGLRLALPTGYVGLVWPRSGLAVRYGIGMVKPTPTAAPLMAPMMGVFISQ